MKILVYVVLISSVSRIIFFVDRLIEILLIIEEKSIQVKWPIINNNDKQTEHFQSLQQLKNFNTENNLPSPLMINNNQAHLFENFDLIKQRYSALADFNLSRGEFLFFVVVC